MTGSPRRVLVLTLSFGSGHVRAGAAVAEALRRQAPDLEVRSIDALERARWLFRAGYVWPYWAMVRYAPRLWDWLFGARLRNRSAHTAPDWAFRFGCPKVFEEIAAFKPDVIVAAEVAAGEIAALARRAGLTTASVVDVVTDHHAEPAWVKPDVHAYAVADETVRQQLIEWGAPASRVFVAGIPIDEAFRARHDRASVRQRFGLDAVRPVVLLMGGGMGPTRMDQIAAGLCASGEPMQIVAVTGHDAAVRRRLTRVQERWKARAATAALTVLGWTDEVAALMHGADLLVTKPGGLTTAEASVAGLPIVMFDAIPGPELHNAERVAAAGAGVLTRGVRDTVDAVVSILRDAKRRGGMARRASSIAIADAAEAIAKAVLEAPAEPNPVVIISIRNGEGHTRVARAIADALGRVDPPIPVRIVDAADYMSWTLRATHVTIYLWLVRSAPRLWGRIDRYQKRQPRTSPEWYYRQGCRRLFDLVAGLEPRAIVATEVGCCEIAALIKRDMELSCPLVAVNGEYDAERSWVRPEVDLYSVPSQAVHDELCGHGAPPWRVRAWGVPLAGAFDRPESRQDARRSECAELRLSSDLPLLLVSGGSEGLGRPDLVAERLLALSSRPQVVVLAGRNARLRRRAESLAARVDASRLRVLGWTERMPALMRAADVMISKLGHTFDEAMAVGLPLVALEPPPGSEERQYELLASLGTGCAVRTLDEMAVAVERTLEARHAPRAAGIPLSAGESAASTIANWLIDATGKPAVAVLARARFEPRTPLRVAEERES